MTTAMHKTFDTFCQSSQSTSPVYKHKSPFFYAAKASLSHLDDELFMKHKEKSLDAISTNTSEDIHRGEDKPGTISEDQTAKKTPFQSTKPTLGAFGDEGNSDNSDNSNISGKFVKVRHGGKEDPEPLKPWENDIDYLFSQDKSKFIGEFHTEEYKIIRGYLPGSSLHLRMYYTKLEPFKKKVATMCIVHGLGGHSGRFMDVTF